MTKHRTTPALLAVVALLLALNLAAQLPWPTAQAQQLQPEMAMQRPPPVQAVAFAIDGAQQQIYRLWSDGLLEYNRIDTFPACGEITNTTWCGWITVPETLAP